MNLAANRNHNLGVIRQMKIRKSHTTRWITRRPAGAALLVSVLVLVVLSSLLASLILRITMVKRRQAYMVEYQRARYALDSAMKYALAVMPNRSFSLTSRAEMPDFSDLFVMNSEEYRLFLETWIETASDDQIEKILKEDAAVTAEPQWSTEELLGRLTSMIEGQTDESHDPFYETTPTETAEFMEFDPDDVQVPGPYGPAWPYVIEPIELQIGSAKVTITVEDENAKMPLTWAITNRQAVNKQAEAALAIFCDWMGMDMIQREALKDQLEEIYDRKTFELNPSPIMLPSQTRTTTTTTAAVTRQTGQVTTTRTTVRTTPTPQRAASQPQQRAAIAHSTDFAKLFHSSLLDREALARPVTHTALPDQSPLKYLALWGSQRVNVNTAPRHVLEAALSFGAGDPTDLVEQIIRKRQQEPIKSINEMKDLFYGDSLAIERAKNYLTTTSNFFLVRVVSQSGNARVSAVATLVKEGRNVERLVILYGL